jgi:hypothetical protein
MSNQFALEVRTVNDMTCPWCEADLVLRVVADEQSCPECGTTWSYEEDEEAQDLALAA